VSELANQGAAAAPVQTSPVPPVRRGALERMYDWIVSYSTHPNAVWVLAIVAFAESSLCPIPPIPLLIPMCLANPRKAWFYAGVCAVASTLGGVIGYGIGYALYETVGQWVINTYGLQAKAAELREQATNYWFWILITKGLTPIPFKLVTIMSGLIEYNFALFMAGSLFARFTFFFLMAAALRVWGDQIRNFIETRLKLATFILLFFLIGGFVLIKYI
jgi:membrane protein YqaA with SNARE-associated domain